MARRGLRSKERLKVPRVDIDRDISAPIKRVWDVLVDVESYGKSMDNVRWSRIVGSGDEHIRRAEWSVLLKGSILEWQEEEHLLRDSHEVVFKQLHGDLEFFDGCWKLEELGPDQTRAHFEVEFEIGIPMLAEMLNPAVQRSLRENCDQMLRGIERTATTG
jgi:ribosome-associated toxin RatA of RatAB toxin-antitoxin module